MQYQLKFGSKLIDFKLCYLERKSLVIKVHPDGTVEVFAPLEARLNEIMLKIRLKAPWIIKQLEYFNLFKAVTPPRQFINGETHLYLGRQYRLKIISDNCNMVKAFRGQLWMHAIDTKQDALKRQLDSWYRQKAFIIFNELIEDILPYFNRFKIQKPSLSIRHMSKRWGSCSPAGKIILNTELIKAPKSCIEYVIVHELCHMVHHNHTKAFRLLQGRILPDWESRKNRLELFFV